MRLNYANAVLALMVVAAGLAAVSETAAQEMRSGASRPPIAIPVLMRQAQDYAGRGDWPSAIRNYEEILKAAPGIAESHSNLGIAYFSSGQPVRAIPALRQALKLKPTLTLARIFLGAALAESGECQEAIPYIKKEATRIADKDLKRTVYLDGVRCSMKLNQADDAAEFIRQLNKDFPDEPEVLYLTVHVYSDMSIRAAQQLVMRAPSSAQVRLLNAEALETQARWDEAAEEYRQVLATNPQLPGIHFRLGRLLLSAPTTSATALSEARREFEEELKNDPNNAGAAYVLGELARRERQWPAAIDYFGRAVKLDPSFADAFIGLGRSLIANRRFPDAVEPLERAVKLQPENPAGHYHLGIAYSRIGRTGEADKEAAVFKEISEKSRQSKVDIQTGILGPQKAEP